MSVLGLDSGYTVKYSPSPSGVPLGEGLYLTVYPSSHPNTDTVYPSSRRNTDTFSITKKDRGKSGCHHIFVNPELTLKSCLVVIIKHHENRESCPKNISSVVEVSQLLLFEFCHNLSF